MALRHPGDDVKQGHGSGVPLPGSFVTPQARAGKETTATHWFFDPSYYHGRVAGLPPMAEAGPMTDLTPENVKNFFDSNTYHGKMVGLPAMGPTQTVAGMKRSQLRKFFDPKTYCKRSPSQKRSSETPPTHPAAKARTMGKEELLEKFKLAAGMNGIDWNELMVPKLHSSVPT